MQSSRCNSKIIIKNRNFVIIIIIIFILLIIAIVFRYIRGKLLIEESYIRGVTLVSVGFTLLGIGFSLISDHIDYTVKKIGFIGLTIVGMLYLFLGLIVVIP